MPYRPRQGYLLLDERRLAKTENLPTRNLSAALFRLDASRGSSETMAIVRALIDWLADPGQLGLRRAFAIWFGRVFLPKRLPGVSFPPLSDLMEVYHMLAETWTPGPTNGNRRVWSKVERPRATSFCAWSAVASAPRLRTRAPQRSRASATSARWKSLAISCSSAPMERTGCARCAKPVRIQTRARTRTDMMQRFDERRRRATGSRKSWNSGFSNAFAV
ncbi:hypothetical protein EDC35_11235 [Thiobaca trueperi]|uniref:Uncharacterized protein n=1 Tax=Thiobaca trueperi TaxID=127458 RepID=A0A4V2V0V6_9GAMM|nr:hypothetical protein EDC35_11235 [Thiobaca trueperi]